MKRKEAPIFCRFSLRRVHLSHFPLSKNPSCPSPTLLITPSPNSATASQMHELNLIQHHQCLTERTIVT